MNALAELVAGWRKEAHKLRVDARSKAVTDLPHLSDMAQAKAAGVESVLDELEAATVGAHLVRWERLEEVIDELPESGLGHIVLARESGQHCSPHVGMYYGDFGWRFARHWVGNYVKLCPDAQVMVIPLGDGEK